MGVSPLALTPGLDVAPTAPRRRIDRHHGALVAGRCSRCGAEAWPRRAICHRCHNPQVDEFVLPADGVATSVTKVWVPLDGLEAPYFVAAVRLGEITMIGHLRDVGELPVCPFAVVVHVD